MELIITLISNHKNSIRNLKKPIMSNKPEFIEVLLKPDQKIVPKLQFGNL